MRRIITEHSAGAYLKPGEVVFSRNPVLVSTILGSCVAVTIFSPELRCGAICHAVYPDAANKEPSLHFVDTAIRHIYSKMIENGCGREIVVKLFGGAKVLATQEAGNTRRTIGELNVIQARQTLNQLGLIIAKQDVGGIQGRKLLFSIKTGEVFLRRLKTSANAYWLGE